MFLQKRKSQKNRKVPSILPLKMVVMKKEEGESVNDLTEREEKRGEEDTILPTRIVLMIVILTHILLTVKLIHTHPHQILVLPVMIGEGGGRNIQKKTGVGVRKGGGTSVVRNVEGGVTKGQNGSQSGLCRSLIDICFCSV